MEAAIKNKNYKNPRLYIKPAICIGLFLVLFLFVIVPIISMLVQLKLDDLKYIFTDGVFYNALGNSLLYSLIASLISVILATITAYLLNRSNIKHKKIFVLLMTLPMLIPTLSIGLGVRLLFGVGGYLDKIFGITFDAVGSMFGLILGSVTISFPIAFLLIYDALQYENKNVYDAAETLGISQFSAFFKITLPYLFVPLVSAFFASFTLIFSDYGVPMEIAGKIKTLPMYLYDELYGFQYGRGAVIGIILIIPALIAFIFDLFTKDNDESEAGINLIKPSKTFNIVTIVLLSIFSVLILLPQISFIITAFVKQFPNDMSFTFDHFKETFGTKLTVGIGGALMNSLIIAFMAALFGTALAYVVAYMTTRSGSAAGKPLHLLSTSSLAIPGLVLGVGYIMTFSGTSGWFYNTMVILIVVNMIHFFASPYLMAKNAFSKINKNYETVGETLGISNVSIFFKVMVPNTLSTIVQMFSYFFVNSMITISAVAFLYNYSNKPLAIFINDYTYRDQSYENAAVVSFVLFAVNAGFKLISDFAVTKLNNKKKKMKEGENMELTRYEFDVLTYIERKGPIALTQRQLADAVTISLGNVNKIMKTFTEKEYITVSDDKTLAITENGIKALEPYKVKKAIILAAGIGERCAPVTFKTPKSLIEVNGTRIVDTLLDALLNVGIDDITMVVGYKKELFKDLLKKYPKLKFIENPEYNTTNNISSVYYAKNVIDRCYICEADLIINNPAIITKYQYCTCYYGARMKETDDWCFYKTGNYISKVAIGGENVYSMMGISYWDDVDSAKLRADIEKVYNSRGGKENFWDNVPLKHCKRDFKIEIKEFFKREITEIDNFEELCFVDSKYKDYK